MTTRTSGAAANHRTGPGTVVTSRSASTAAAVAMPRATTERMPSRVVNRCRSHAFSTSATQTTVPTTAPANTASRASSRAWVLRRSRSRPRMPALDQARASGDREDVVGFGRCRPDGPGAGSEEQDHRRDAETEEGIEDRVRMPASVWPSRRRPAVRSAARRRRRWRRRRGGRPRRGARRGRRRAASPMRATGGMWMPRRTLRRLPAVRHLSSTAVPDRRTSRYVAIQLRRVNDTDAPRPSAWVRRFTPDGVRRCSRRLLRSLRGRTAVRALSPSTRSRVASGRSWRRTSATVPGKSSPSGGSRWRRRATSSPRCST